MLAIRMATKDDAGTLQALIAELAHEEALEAELDLSSTGINRLLAEHSPVGFLLAEYGGSVVAYCAWCYTLSTFKTALTLFIEDVYVKPSYRGRGVGSDLLAAAAAWARSEHLPRVEWRVQASNHAAIDLFQKAGIEPTSNWHFCRMSAVQIGQWADLAGKRST